MPGAQTRDDFRWDDVKVFLAVHRERTLAGAAARLGVDASTVSRRLAAFEAAMGVQLFDRHRDGLLPTAAAEQVLPAANEVDAAARRLARSAGQLESAAEGLVRLTCAPGLAETFVVPLLAELCRHHPRIRFEVDASQAVADLTRGEADIAMRTVRPTSGPDLVIKRLMHVPYGVVACREYASSLGTIEDARAVRWVSWNPSLFHLVGARWFAAHVSDVEPVLRVSSLAASLAAVEAGLGAAVLPRVYAALRDLVVVPFAPALAAMEAALPADDVWLVGHRALRDVPRVAAVWEFFVEAARRLPEA